MILNLFSNVLPPQTSVRMAWSFKVLSWPFCEPSLSGFRRRHQSDLKESLAAFNVLLGSPFFQSAHMCCTKMKYHLGCVFAPLLSPTDCSLLNLNPLSYESSAHLDLMNTTQSRERMRWGENGRDWKIGTWPKHESAHTRMHIQRVRSMNLWFLGWEQKKLGGYSICLRVCALHMHGLMFYVWTVMQSLCQSL